jgi:ubiquinone/menaquinone biosynthesis C-methylase UbiE
MSEQREKPAGFDGYAKNYAELMRNPIRDSFADGNQFFFERKLQVIRGFFKRLGVATQNLDWLDIGCGQGDLLRLGHNYFKSSAGCDPSRGMLESCSDLNVRTQLSMLSLPFDSQSFDFLTTVCVYHHVPHEDRAAFTLEAFRLLKPNGVFCVIEHNALNPVTQLIVSRTPMDADAQLMSAKAIRNLLCNAGGRILKTKYFLLFPERIHKYAGVIEDCLMSVPFGGQYAVFAQR